MSEYVGGTSCFAVARRRDGPLILFGQISKHCWWRGMHPQHPQWWNRPCKDVQAGSQSYALHCVSVRLFPTCISLLCILLIQWRAEGGADGATAPGIHPGGHPRGQFSLKM